MKFIYACLFVEMSNVFLVVGQNLVNFPRMPRVLHAYNCDFYNLFHLIIS